MIVAATPENRERVVFRMTPTQAHTWMLCGGFFRAQYRSGKPFVATYSSLLGTSVHELVAAFDRSRCDSQHSLDNWITRNWRTGRFAGVDDLHAQSEAATLLAAYAALRQTEEAQI